MEVVQSRYDLELSDVNYIIERYQQRAYEVDPLMGSYASFLNVVESSRQVIDIGMDSINYADVGTGETPPSMEGQEDLVGDIECSTDKDFEQVPISNSSTNEGIQVPLPDEVQQVADVDSRSDIEKCIECEERPENSWEFSFKPIFAMDGFRDLLSTLSATMDDLLRQLDPFSFVNGLCPFLDTFAERTCKYDMKALLGLINMLIARYSTSALEMTLNWSTLLGPMVKGVAEIASTLAEEIMKEVSYIFKCLKTYLLFAKDLMNQVQQLITDTSNLVDQAIVDPIKSLGSLENYKNSSIDRLHVNQQQNTVGNNSFALDKTNLAFTETGIGKNLMSGRGTYRTGPTYTLPSANFYSSKQTPGGPKKKGLINGFTGSYSDNNLEKMFGVGANAKNMKGVAKGVQATSNAIGTVNTELIDRLLAMMNSAEQFIKGLLSNLVLSLKSLDGMMSQGFNSTVKLGGIILFLTDMFQLILSMLEGKFGFQGGICKSLEEGDFKLFEDALKGWYGTDEIFDVAGLENGQVRIDSGIYNIDVKCGWPSEVTEEQRSQNLNYVASKEGNLDWLFDVFGNE